MKNTFGNSVSLTLFGESHGEAIGAVLDGLAPGLEVNEEFIEKQLCLRRPSGAISTARVEKDKFSIVSGVFQGKTTGTPLTIIIPNEDKKSHDYGQMAQNARPGHADYTAQCKYHGYQDYRGGGHFSGRITAAIVAACAILIYALRKKGVYIGTHISSLGNINDMDIYAYTEEQLLAVLEKLSEKPFPVIADDVAKNMEEEILNAKNQADSIGGVLETAVLGLPDGVGEPWFDTLEGVLAHGLFSIPAVKGVEFGKGFSLSQMTGSKANDEFFVEDGVVSTYSNNNGGINGGISNGRPLIFRCCVKPTPTIGKEQRTIDFIEMKNTVLAAKGRHDPCIVHRARVVVDSMTALALCDMLALRYGTDWLAE